MTVYRKTRHMGFFVKVEFDASMIGCPLENFKMPTLVSLLCHQLGATKVRSKLGPKPE